MKRTQMILLSIGILTCCATGPVLAQRDLSDRQLEAFRQRNPQADTNRDGTLTQAEARAFREQRPRTAQNPTAAAIQPTAADVAYGPHSRQVFDFYKAEAAEPTPLIVYIHGGGFVGGDKKSIDKTILAAALSDGISCAALHYRLVDGQEVIFPAPQLDCALALQTLRAHADKYNIDPQRIVCFGGSAGAGISMWLGFHDDLAEPESSDPIRRQSTRLTAIGTFGGQSTYDPIKIKALVGGRAWEHPSLRLVYGLKTTAEALSPSKEMQTLYDQSSAIFHLTADDPPLFMVYSEADAPLPADARPGQGIHHPNFGKDLVQAMDKLEIENKYVHTDDTDRVSASQQMYEFFKTHLTAPIP